MKREEFEFIAALVRQRSGFVVAPEKAYLVEKRLMPVIQRSGRNSGLAGLIEAIKADPAGATATSAVDAMVTKETYFFRHPEAFRVLREEIVPRLQIDRAPDRKLRIWSAGCATGQEAYSVAMALSEMVVELSGWSVEVHATDLSRDAVQRGATGLYNRFEVQRGLPVRMLLKHFDEAPDEKWQISSKLRETVTFREANLLEPANSFGPFDLILCRNVLGLFDADTQAASVERLAGVLNVGGMLMLTPNERVAGMERRFQPVDAAGSVYRLLAATAAVPEEPAVEPNRATA